MPFKSEAARREYLKIWNARNVVKVLWIRLRNHAKERNIHCPITLAEFTTLCEETGYHIDRQPGPMDADTATLDRIDTDRAVGYAYGNIRVLKNKDNVARGNMDRCGIDWDSWKPVDNIESF